MRNYNFIFPGQGSQSVGMSKDILISDRSKTLFNKVSELIGYDLLDICLNGPDDLLVKTKNTQPSIFTISILIDEMLKECNIFPKSVAGHSLGEYAALVSSNVLGFQDALNLIILRCKEMEKANNLSDGLMAAVLNASEDDINEIISLAKGVLVVANYNTKSQIVISGEKTEINSAIDNFRSLSKKIKCIKLNVSGAYHSPLMKFATRPKKIPTGATHAITSNKKNVFKFLLTEKIYVTAIIPIKAPWKDIPPSQTFKISIGL